MDKIITDERTGLTYELIGDYYFVAGEDDPPKAHLGIWGQKHERYLKKHRKSVYAVILAGGTLASYLNQIDEQAEQMFFQLVAQLAEKEGVTEQLKAANQMAWVTAMNNIRNRAEGIVNTELIFV